MLERLYLYICVLVLTKVFYYLMENEIEKANFNTYGSRRGNDLIMARGTFANVKLVNKLASKTGPWTKHIPSGKEMAPFDAAMKYKESGH